MELSDVINEMFPAKAQAEEIKRRVLLSSAHAYAAFGSAGMNKESQEFAQLAKAEFDSLIEYLDVIIKKS